LIKKGKRIRRLDYRHVRSGDNVREIQGYIEEIYGVLRPPSGALISQVTDGVMEEVWAW
jgi:transposase-like protein